MKRYDTDKKPVPIIHFPRLAPHQVADSALLGALKKGSGSNKSKGGRKVNNSLPKAQATITSSSVVAAHPFDLLGDAYIPHAHALVAEALGKQALGASNDKEAHLALAELGEFLSQDVDALQETVNALVLRLDAVEKNIPLSTASAKALKKQKGLDAALSKAAKPVVAVAELPLEVGSGAVSATTGVAKGLLSTAAGPLIKLFSPKKKIVTADEEGSASSGAADATVA